MWGRGSPPSFRRGTGPTSIGPPPLPVPWPPQPHRQAPGSWEVRVSRAQRPRELWQRGLAMTLWACGPRSGLQEEPGQHHRGRARRGDLLQVLLRQEVRAQGLWLRAGRGHPEHGQGGVARHQTRGVSTPTWNRGPTSASGPGRAAGAEGLERPGPSPCGAMAVFPCTGRSPENGWAPLLCPQTRKPSQSK